MGLYPAHPGPCLCLWQWHLSVREQESDGQALQASLEQDLLDIFTPLGHAIVLGQLNLEAFVLGPGDRSLAGGMPELEAKC